MAEINTNEKHDKKGGKPKLKKVSTRIDFTPMVDLGFLLITFFMLTTTLIKPQTMEISMPSRDKVSEDQQTKVKASQAITIIVDKENKVYYYFGTRENDIDPEVISTDFSPNGIRKVLLQRNVEVVLKMHELKIKRDKNELTEDDFKKQSVEIKALKSAPIVIIKATDDANYRNLIDILDEMQICNVSRYAVVDISPFDLDLIKKFRSPV
jgi:biopolymer transport protein ExbD